MEGERISRGLFLRPAYYSVMSTNDDMLKALLKQWRDIEPRGNFEANVWRRIRLAEAAHPERVTIAEWLQRLLWQPAFSLGAAVVIGTSVGLWNGLRAVPKPTPTAQSEFGLPGVKALWLAATYGWRLGV